MKKKSLKDQGNAYPIIHRYFGVCYVYGVFVFPALYSFYFGFTDWTGMSVSYNFVWFDNFVKVFQDTRLFNAVGFTMLYTVVFMALCMPFYYTGHYPDQKNQVYQRVPLSLFLSRRTGYGDGGPDLERNLWPGAFPPWARRWESVLSSNLLASKVGSVIAVIFRVAVARGGDPHGAVHSGHTERPSDLYDARENRQRHRVSSSLKIVTLPF